MLGSVVPADWSKEFEMPKQKDLKRIVRARMQKTGESYTTARAQVTKKRQPKGAPIPPDLAAIAGMSDDAVRSKTGKTWRQWVVALDALDAVALEHKQIARKLQVDFDVSPWWSQTVTVAYERIRGLRDTGQRRGGGYDVNKSKTVPVAIGALYDAFSSRKRGHWLGDAELRVRTATREKSMRLDWHDGTRVDVYFWEKGPAKSQVQLQHRGFPAKAAADRARAEWTSRLQALASYLRA